MNDQDMSAYTEYSQGKAILILLDIAAVQHRMSWQSPLFQIREVTCLD